MNNEFDSLLTSIDELESEYRKKPEYRKAERKVRTIINIATDINRIRNQKGLTQKELAEKANTHQSRVSKIETGDLDFRISTLLKIVEALECDLYMSFCTIEDFGYSENHDNYEVLLETIIQPMIESKENTFAIFESNHENFQAVS
jgi:transcriptional regulator with XRE-family HTH domain